MCHAYGSQFCNVENRTAKRKCVSYISTQPQSSGTRVQAMDDGFMEVVGLFGAAQMAALQVGDTGNRQFSYCFMLSSAAALA